jgi:uncharacterized membrane protein (UPF0136 family)
MTISQRTKIENGDLRSNRRWLVISLLAGLLPVFLDTFQGFISPLSYFESNEQLALLVDVLIIALIFSVPLFVCSFAALRLYKGWKLVPILMLIFNVFLMLLYVALANWNTSA